MERGGILVAWRNSVGSTGQIKVGVHNVSFQFRLQAGQTWWLTCVYGQQANDKKSIIARTMGHQISSSWVMDHSR
jgi:hypothetical protein